MTEHRMRIAKLSPQLAKRLRLSSNYHARVWCECMNDTPYAPGTFTRSIRPLREVLDDPRRLGQWDALGVIDLRVLGSAADLYRTHIEAAAA